MSHIYANVTVRSLYFCYEWPDREPEGDETLKGKPVVT